MLSARSKSVPTLLLLLLGVALPGLVIVATGMGYLPITAGEVARVLAAKLTGDGSYLAGLNRVLPVVVIDVRLPRILTSALVGGGLAVAGVIFQAILLNPLADPYTLGVSSGAAFGASLALLVNFTVLSSYSVPLFAFGGALAALVAVLALASGAGRFSATTLILAGVIVAAILSAGIGFIKYLADEKVSVIIFWLMGSFASKGWLDVGLTLAAALLALTVGLYFGRDLNIMALGPRAADSLGVDTVRTRKILLIVGSLVTAVCVSVSGIIGFVGLIVPHLLRFLVGPDNRRLLPLAFLAGALLLLAADTLSRAVLPKEVPIGVLTALLGGPVFCYLFRRRQLGRRHG